MNARHHNPHTIGFTLIELLVVISIIALLISILLPALRAARDSTAQLMCISNNRQLGIGFHTYMDANEDIAPPYVDYMKTAADRHYWPGMVSQSMGINWRPTSSNLPEYLLCSKQETRQVTEPYVSYGYNYLQMSWWFTYMDPTGWRKVRRLEWKRPASLVILTETEDNTDPRRGRYYIEDPQYSYVNCAIKLAKRHPSYGSGANSSVATLWGDGHVTAEQHADLLDDASRWLVKP